MHIFITSYQNKIFSVIIFSKGKMIRKSKKIGQIDQGLLPFLESIQRTYGSITGIGIIMSSLGGFASSRLIVVTLNAYAWAKDIPIVRVSDVGSPEQQIDQVSKKLKTKRRFIRQVVTKYIRPADITPSKSRPKFTVA